MNPHSLKRNCKRCKAFTLSCGGTGECSLGYKLKTYSFDVHGFSACGEPQEPCPKPITYGDYIYADKHYKKPK